MKRYRDWSPTVYDAKGINAPDYQDWLVVGVIQTRDSDPLDESNFASAEKLFKQYDKDEEDHTVLEFNHWACGWFKIIVVKPGTQCEVDGNAIGERLQDYPILDEDDFSYREEEAKQESWRQMSVRERVELLQRFDHCIFAARRDDWPGELDFNGGMGDTLLGH